MADTWQTMKSELEDLLDDAAFASAGSLNAYLLTWSNRIVKDICLEADVRRHLTSADLTTATATYIYDFATYISDFLKISDRFTKVRVDDSYPTVVTLEELNDYDPDHDDTTTNEDPTVVAIEGNYLYSYPQMGSACVFTLENYLREPTDMTATTSTVDLPWIYYVSDMVVAGVTGRYGFPWLNEYEQAKFWENRYREWLEKYKYHIGKSDSEKPLEGTYY